MIDITELWSMLDCIPVTSCNYQEWVDIGMAIKSEGFPVDVWDEWSRPDSRYSAGACERKWETFEGDGITIATLCKRAIENGYKKQKTYSTVTYDWDDFWLEDEQGSSVPLPSNWDPCKELKRYLEILFDSEDFVGFNAESYKTDKGKYVPKNAGCYSYTASKLIEELSRTSDITDVIGTYNESAGAWIRFNSLDGSGVKNENVTSYRYCLVESDNNSIDEQYSKLKATQLPIALIVHSGGKSLHAIVRVDASGKEQYNARVKKIYEVCQKYGLEVDKQNKNPSRLSRMPGVKRGDNIQYIVAENLGFRDYEEWNDWLLEQTDDYPPFDYLDINHLPPKSPEVIEGILRKGHKLLITAPSKAGKSFALIELACAMASGKEWLGFNVRQGKVLYVNFEIDKDSFAWRVKAVAESMGIDSTDIFSNLITWTLRGRITSLSALAPTIIKRCKNENFDAVILDPIYKVQNGDENSAGDIAKFCNEIDTIANELGVSMIYAHHHAKGSQDGRSAVDRGSGSGVFARDPDALIDMLQVRPEDVGVTLDEGETAFKVAFTLREFRNPTDIYIVFDYPTHRLAPELEGAEALNSCQGSVNLKRANEEKHNKKLEKLEEVASWIAQQEADGKIVRVKEICEQFEVTRQTVYRWIDDSILLSKDEDGHIHSV